MKNVMLDLETMGTGSNAAIVAIGACVFDPHGTDESIGRANNFYEKVDLESSVDAGMQIDARTVLWWMKQSEAARKSTFEGETLNIDEACYLFGNWLLDVDHDVAVWGNGATFDNVIIRYAFKCVDLHAPWSFKNDKCYRTVVNLPGAEKVAFVRSGTSHYALDDAITQAVHLQKVLKELRI